MIKSIIKLGIFSVISVFILQSCADQKQSTAKTKIEFADTPEGKAKKLIYEMEQVNGGWSNLLSKKDVQYQYEYHDYGKGKDISTERIIFQGETSYGKYSQHQVNVFPSREGEAIQLLKDGNITATLGGQEVTNKEGLMFSKFIREVNPYWFSMMYKMSDPSVQPKFEGVEKVNGIDYNKVTVSYSGTGKEADDGYILYFNPKSKLVDFFYFSLPFAGVDKPVLKMEMKYEEIDGVLIATERIGVFPNPETGEYVEGGKYLTTNVKFNNGYTKENITQ